MGQIIECSGGGGLPEGARDDVAGVACADGGVVMWQLLGRQDGSVWGFVDGMMRWVLATDETRMGQSLDFQIELGARVSWMIWNLSSTTNSS
jgi:hypothetical protein